MELIAWLAILGIPAGLALAAGAGVICLLMNGDTGTRASDTRSRRRPGRPPARHAMTVPLAAAGTERIPVVRSLTSRQPWDTAVRPAVRDRA